MITVENATDDQRMQIEREEGINSQLKKLKQDANTAAGDANLTLGEMKREIDESSIENIRSRMKAPFDDLMNMVKSIARNWSKIFYLTILAVVVDAI